MSRFTLEGVARGVARNDLYEFYIDFRGDDTEILQGKRALPYDQKIRRTGHTTLLPRFRG